MISPKVKEILSDCLNMPTTHKHSMHAIRSLSSSATLSTPSSLRHQFCRLITFPSSHIFLKIVLCIVYHLCYQRFDQNCCRTDKFPNVSLTHFRVTHVCSQIIFCFDGFSIFVSSVQISLQESKCKISPPFCQ